MSEPIVIPLRSRRRQRVLLVHKLKDVFPAGVLLFAGLQQFTEEPHGWALVLAIVEIVSSALMLAALVKKAHENRHLLKRTAAPGDHHSHAAHHSVEWENFVAAAVVLAEGWEHRMHGGHHFPRPAILMAIVLLVTGLLHGRLMGKAQRRRSLRVSDEGLCLPTLSFRARKMEADWADIASIEVGERWAVVTTRLGDSRKLDLQDLEDPDHVRHALAEAQHRLEVIS
jgi:hypothetical protein